MAGKPLGEDEVLAEINITPLVDVVLVLLIVLMVTATAVVAKTIPVDLPKAATGEQKTITLAISIDDKGKLFLDTQPKTRAELRAALRSARRKDPGLRAFLAADGRLAHSAVVSVMDLLRQEKVHRFAINVTPQRTPRSAP